MHTLKRAIYLIGPQSINAYYSAQLILVTFILVGSALALMRLVRFPQSLRWLLLFAGVGVVTTALGGEPWSAKAASVVDFVVPSAIFPLALLIRATDLGRIAKCYITLLGVSVLYGVTQFLAGPTLVDRAWAVGAGESSRQAGVVLEALNGSLSDLRDLFRPYSFYADPQTFGLFAIAALGIVCAARSLGKLTTGTYVFGVSLCVIAAVLTLSRSSVMGILLTAGIYVLLRRRMLRKPVVLLVLYAGAFVAANTLSEFLSKEYGDFGSDTDNVVAMRFETTGTLSDRAHSLDLFRELFTPRNLPGRGYAYNAMSAVRGFGVEDSPIMRSHSIVIGIMLATGIPGAVLLTLFLLRVISDGLSLAAMSGVRAKAMRWLAACLLANLVLGLTSGNIVLNMHFYIIAGILAAAGRYVGSGQSQPAASVHSIREFRELAVQG